MAPPSWKTAFDAYPANDSYIWLNNAGTTPAGRHVVARMSRHFQQLASVGPECTSPDLSAVLGAIRQRLARLLRTEPTNIALIHNTAEGMTMLSLGLTLKPDDEVLLLEDEYPSNVYPWQIWQERGIKIRFVPVGRSPEAFLETFRAELTARTRVVALSMVHWCTGMPLPYEQVAELCRERGIFFALDGSQGIGQLPLDFGRLAPMALCFSAWKWLLGPLGLGVLVADPDTISRLNSPFRGTDSVVNPHSYLPYQTEQKATAERYSYSTANTNDWVYFDESLAFLDTFGFEQIMPRILQLTARLWLPLKDHGFTSGYEHELPQSGILSVAKPGCDMTRIAEALAAQGVVARVRLGRLRLAPHVYLDEAQLDRVVGMLVDLADRKS